MRTIRRVAPALMALAGTVPLAWAPLPVAASPVRAAALSAARLHWGRCPAPPPGISVAPAADKLQCATLTVPMDYRQPHVRTIKIAVSRLPSMSSTRRGVLVINLGGPGGAGLFDPITVAGLAPRRLLDSYDIVSFDPRGVGRSAPVSCGLTSLTRMIRTVFPWPLPGGVRQNAALARRVARRCAARMGTVMPFITTANTARDIDRLRGALGQQRISYLGYSYGTYLGAVYASLFPNHTDRILLDSATSPKGIWRRAGFRVAGPAIELRFPDFASWAAARHRTYRLGRTPRQVRVTYITLTASLDRQPVASPPGVAVPCGVLTGELFRVATIDALSGHQAHDFPGLAALWNLAEHGRPVPPVRPGISCDRPDPATENSVASQLAVVCDDAAWPRSIARYQHDVRHDRRRYPIAGPWAANIWPCAFWPSRALEPPVPITGHGPSNILILNNLRDPATPFFGAQELRRALGHRARLVAVDQGGHAIYLFARDTCANNIATAFLTTGTRPPDGSLCPATAPGQTPETRDVRGLPARAATARPEAWDRRLV